MITEEYIAEEAKEYAEASTINGRIPYGIDDTEVIQDAFTYGTKWYKKNLWHPFQDEPKQFEDIIYIDVNGEFGKVWTDLEWSEKCRIYGIEKWCYCKDLIL